MFFYKITIQYRGAGFQGWQIQPQGDTLQGELNRALQKICKSDNISSLASGRTDTGVNAIGQVVRISIPFHIKPSGLIAALNSNLHHALRVTDITEVNDNFHPIRDAQAKEYRYFFRTAEINDLFINPYAVSLPYPTDFNLLQMAAKEFIGTFNFNNFHTTGSNPQSTIREVLEAEIIHSTSSSNLPPFVSDYYYLRIKGKGFLKQMVRAIMGAIWAVASEKKTIAQLQASLGGESTQRIGAVAPPHGLYLWKVWY